MTISSIQWKSSANTVNPTCTYIAKRGFSIQMAAEITFLNHYCYQVALYIRQHIVAIPLSISLI